MAGAAWYILAATLLIGAGLTVLQVRHALFREQVERRFLGMTKAALPRQPARNWYVRTLRRAGVTPHPRYLAIAFALQLLLVIIGWRIAGGAAALLLGLCYLLALYLILQLLYRRRVERIGRQLPMFVDHVIRALHTGSSLESALNSAAEQTQPPLKEVTDRVRRSVQVGSSLADALEDAARLYEIRYLYILTMGARVNARYGSSAVGLFKSLQQMIQGRERASRELRALTGETRLSAVVLAVLPVGLAAYILAMNPGYLATMWSDPGGRTMILAALAWQALGLLIIWRMIRSI